MMTAHRILETRRRVMEICHSHNLIRPLDQPKPYGIRVRLQPGDTFERLLGSTWEQHHWFGSREERDRALGDMADEHLYSRRGDRPTLVLEPVERRGESVARA
jgi:hypothetical protein